MNARLNISILVVKEIIFITDIYDIQGAPQYFAWRQAATYPSTVTYYHKSWTLSPKARHIDLPLFEIEFSVLILILFLVIFFTFRLA